jgi:hypothetical protein
MTTLLDCQVSVRSKRLWMLYSYFDIIRESSECAGSVGPPQACSAVCHLPDWRLLSCLQTLPVLTVGFLAISFRDCNLITMHLSSSLQPPNQLLPTLGSYENFHPMRSEQSSNSIVIKETGRQKSLLVVCTVKILP